MWQGLYRRKNKKKRSRNSCLEEREEKDENMKLFDHPEVLEFYQRGEELTWILLAYHPLYRFMCMFCFNFRWLSVTESFIPFHILSHPSSPLHSNRPRWSKCLTFVARMYPRVLVYWFAVFQRRCDSYIFRMLIQVRSSYPELAFRKNEIYTFWSQISHACKCPRWLNENEVWVFFRLPQAPFIAYQSKQNLTIDALGTWINRTL